MSSNIAGINNDRVHDTADTHTLGLNWASHVARMPDEFIPKWGKFMNSEG